MRYGDIFVHENDLPDDLVFAEGDLAIDTEAMGLDHLNNRLCLVQLSLGDGMSHLVHFKSRDYAAPNLKRLLSDQGRMKIFHFARFDVAAIKHYLGIRLTKVFCTKIASKLARTYTDSHSLKDLCYDMLSVKISKAQQSSDWGSLRLTPMQIEYAASDVLHLHKLRDILTAMLEREGKIDLARSCFDFLPTRAELDLCGWADRDIFQHGV